MSSEQPIVHKQPPMQTNPFAKELAQHVSAGTVAIESERAIAEAQGKLVIAKRFPRDQARAYAAIMDACRRPGLAEEAIYSFPRGGQTISGSSIRLAETLAREWGNLDYGLRELSRKEGVSEMEAYCWDLETNVMSSQKFTVRHIRDTRGGGVKLTDERDIYELTANQGSRRVRARILAIIPPDVETAAVNECKKTLAGGNDGGPLIDRVRKMAVAFSQMGVTTTLIEKRLGHSLDAMLPDELADLRAIHNSLRDGMSKVHDWFGDKPEQMPGDPDEQPKRDAAPPPVSGVAAALAPEGEKKRGPGRPRKDESKVVEGEVVTETKATPAPEQAKEAPKAETRTALNAGEKFTAICTVKSVKADMVKKAGQEQPSIIAELEGQFTGKVYALNQAPVKDGVPQVPEEWTAGKPLVLELLGEARKARPDPKFPNDRTKDIPMPCTILVQTAKIHEPVAQTAPAEQGTGENLE